MASNGNANYTELIWSGKFNEEVKLPHKRLVDKISLPFQTIEVINEPREGMAKFTQEYIDTADKVQKQVYKELITDILNLTAKRLNKQISSLVVLDVGSSTGEIAFEVSKKVKKVIGVEPYRNTYLQALKKNKWKNVKFYNKLIEEFDTAQRFDLALSLTTLEHMPNADASFKRIFRLLKPDGILYLTAPNKLWPYDYHYGLPFIMWMPLWLANFYVKITGKGTSFKDASYAKTYYGVKKLFTNLPCKYEFLLPDPAASYLGLGFLKEDSFEVRLRRLGIKLIKRFPLMWMFSKGFIIIAQKTPELQNGVNYTGKV